MNILHSSLYVGTSVCVCVCVCVRERVFVCVCVCRRSLPDKKGDFKGLNNFKIFFVGFSKLSKMQCYV